MLSLSSSKRSLHRREVRINNFTCVVRVSLSAIVLNEESLFTKILLYKFYAGLVSSRKSQEVRCLSVNGEETHGSAILRTHVGKSSTIRDGNILDTRAVEFNEFANNTALSQHLGASEHKVSCCDLGLVEDIEDL